MSNLEKFGRMFGIDARCTRMLLTIQLAARGLPEGDLKTGMILAVESGACFLDGDAGDGGAQMLTLMEQVTGLLDGSYGLVEIGMTKDAETSR